MSGYPKDKEILKNLKAGFDRVLNQPEVQDNLRRSEAAFDEFAKTALNILRKHWGSWTEPREFEDE